VNCKLVARRGLPKFLWIFAIQPPLGLPRQWNWNPSMGKVHSDDQSVLLCTRYFNRVVSERRATKRLPRTCLLIKMIIM